MTPHVPTEELAEADAGLLSGERTTAVAAHLAGCDSCRRRRDEISSITDHLRALPAPVMPAAIVRRLDGVLATEVRSRAVMPVRSDSEPMIQPPSGAAPRAVSAHRSAPVARRGPTGGPTTGRIAALLLAAAAMVVAVAVGGYRLGTVQGWSEPPVSGATLSSGDLGTAGATVRRRGHLVQHPFSRAWWCARTVVPGHITGLTGATVDGAPALLVYARTPAGSTVNVVRGCEDSPILVESARLPG